MQKCLVVVGGGAAGFFCAVNAARMNPRLNVILLEKTSKLLSKVKISGGGRCNVTHALFDVAEMSKRYPRGQNFVKRTFYQFFTTNTIQWFEEREIKLKAEKDKNTSRIYAKFGVEIYVAAKKGDPDPETNQVYFSFGSTEIENLNHLTIIQQNVEREKKFIKTVLEKFRF